MVDTVVGRITFSPFNPRKLDPVNKNLFSLQLFALNKPDEIAKKYFTLKQENERLKKEIEKLTGT